MKYFHFPDELRNIPIRLNKEEIEHPEKVVKEFFSFYNLNHIRMELGNLLELAMSVDTQDLGKGVNRVNMMQFNYQIEALIESVYKLHCISGTK